MVDWNMIGGLAAILPLVWVGVKQGHSKYKQLTMKRKEERALVAQMMSQLPAIVEQVNSIKKEFVPNGGGSLRDQLNRIESRQVYSRFMHRKLADKSHVIWFEADTRGNWTDTCYRISLIFDAPPIELLNNNWLSFIVQSERARVSDEWGRCIEEHSTFNVRTAIITRNGIIKELDILAEQVVEGGLCVGIFGEIHEVHK